MGLPLSLTWNGSVVGWNHNSPVYQNGREWENLSSRVEDAEPCAILSRSILAGWRDELLEAGCSALLSAAMVRVVEVHEGPGLR